jgi:rhodanese-related sulfurtransferase
VLCGKRFDNTLTIDRRNTVGIADYFKPVDTMTPDEVRDFLNKHNPGEYNLVDVRQPREYEREHLPGAQLIPVAELSEKLSELDPNKPTITY